MYKPKVGDKCLVLTSDVFKEIPGLVLSISSRVVCIEFPGPRYGFYTIENNNFLKV